VDLVALHHSTDQLRPFDQASRGDDQRHACEQRLLKMIEQGL
jgi:hypothetical protein